MNSLMKMGTSPLMNSVEIAELTGKRHDHVLVDIRKMLAEIQSPEKSGDYKDKMGRIQPCLMLDKEESLCLVAGYNADLRMRIIRRWQQLEQWSPKVPQNLPDALRLAAELAEQNMVLEQKLAENVPKVEFADMVAGVDKGIHLGNFAKTVGIGPKRIFSLLHELGILIKGGNRHNLPYQEYLERGYFTVVERPYMVYGEMRLGFSPLLTGTGQQWLVKKLLDSGYLKGVAA
ncbi:MULTISPECIES: phage antirepressor KilAC domain-containing protein [Aeromonas]|uniref:phage antirepressor KilAC domain-containing protein n=1 Tax=Aeromonas TaxID=642 RepID=UPI0005AA3782|nr:MULTISPECIES: phage regulatory protein/antirepressor Ant [Aeromonas]QXC29901.1 phage regulatory protein/antirepressor Ant [Aeromonas sp. FDAARGOS 1409]